MSVGCLVLVFTSIVDTVPLLLLVTKAVLPSGVIATSNGPEPTAMSVGCLVLVFTSIVDTVPLTPLVTKAVLPSGVTATPNGPEPTVMSVGCLVLVFTSIVDTVPLPLLVTKAVLPSGVTATPTRLRADGDVGGMLGPGLHIDRRHRAADGVGDEGGLAVRRDRHPDRPGPTAMSVGCLVLVFTSIVDTVPLPPLVTKAVARHRARAATADTPPGTTPTSAPANPSTKTPEPTGTLPHRQLRPSLRFAAFSVGIPVPGTRRSP